MRTALIACALSSWLWILHPPCLSAASPETQVHEPPDKQDQHNKQDQDNKHDEHDDENRLPVPDETQRQELGIVHALADAALLHETIRLNGEITLNEEHTAHVTLPLPGIITRVYKQLGDTVNPKDPLALLESRELADLKTEYLVTLEQVALAQDHYQRKAPLFAQKALPEQQLFEIKRNLVESQLRQTSAKRKLQALGFTQESLRHLDQQDERQLTAYTLLSPLGGTIVEKHITPGELFAENGSGPDETRAFTISNLSELWIDFSVYPQDLSVLREGQLIILDPIEGLPEAQVKIIHVSPLIDRETRMALVRARLPNPDGQWRAGLFVSAEAQIRSTRVPIAVPPSALVQTVNGYAVFVAKARSYHLRPVKIGRRDRQAVEIQSGLASQETYVSQGSFILKAEQDKAAFASDGHAH